MLKRAISLILPLGLLAGCNANLGTESSFPKSPQQQEIERVGKLTGESGWVIFGGKKESEATKGINVNSYLWRATLDTVYFMPLISADPFGGTVLTDWYQTGNNTRERYKLNILIVGGELRSDAIRVAAFKQKKSSRGTWIGTDISPQVAADIENKILARARELKVTKLSG